MEGASLIEQQRHWRTLVTRELCPDHETFVRFEQRLESGLLTRDEHPPTHFSVYFLPINSISKRVFLVHHKKANIWLSPGGHVDRGEYPEQTLAREIREELGISYLFTSPPRPFLFTIVDINDEKFPCKTHFDLWYAIETEGQDFQIDPVEFYETRWLAIPEARTLVTDPSNLYALQKIEKGFLQGNTRQST